MQDGPHPTRLSILCWVTLAPADCPIRRDQDSVSHGTRARLICVSPCLLAPPSDPVWLLPQEGAHSKASTALSECFLMDGGRIGPPYHGWCLTPMGQMTKPQAQSQPPRVWAHSPGVLSWYMWPDPGQERSPHSQNSERSEAQSCGGTGAGHPSLLSLVWEGCSLLAS